MEVDGTGLANDADDVDVDDEDDEDDDVDDDAKLFKVDNVVAAVVDDDADNTNDVDADVLDDDGDDDTNVLDNDTDGPACNCSYLKIKRKDLHNYLSLCLLVDL